MHALIPLAHLAGRLQKCDYARYILIPFLDHLERLSRIIQTWMFCADNAKIVQHWMIFFFPIERKMFIYYSLLDDFNNPFFG